MSSVPPSKRQPSSSSRGPPKKKDNSKFWCEYCRVYIYDNVLCRRNHENSPQHRDAIKRHVSKLQKRDQETRTLEREFSARTGVAFGESEAAKANSFYTKSLDQPKERPLTTLTVGKVTKKSLPKKQIALKNLSALEENAEDRLLASQAIIGQWSEVQSDMEDKKSEAAVSTIPLLNDEQPLERKSTGPIKFSFGSSLNKMA